MSEMHGRSFPVDCEPDNYPVTDDAGNVVAYDLHPPEHYRQMRGLPSMAMEPLSPPDPIEVACPRCGLRIAVPWHVKWEDGRPTANISVDMAPIEAHVATHFG